MESEIDMNIGIIDIGSNTIRLNVYKLEEKTYSLLFSKKESVGLISYVIKKSMSLEGITKLKMCLTRFQTILKSLSIQHIHAFATASLRNLKNTQEIIDIIFQSTGMKIELISGTMEGYLSFLGAMHQIQASKGIYIDSGGASTEFVFYENFEKKQIQSLNIGSLNLFNKYVKKIIPTRQEEHEIKQRILKELQTIHTTSRIQHLTATGGNMRAIRSLFVYLGRISQDTYDFSSKLVLDALKELSENRTKTMHLFLKIKPERVHTMYCALLILDTIISYFSIENIQICTNGIREGYLIHKYIGEQQ